MYVLMIGAGVSNLSAAAALVKAGVKVTIFEKSSTIGGLAASFTRNNYIFDYGPHIFFGKRVLAELNKFFDVNNVIIENSNLNQAIYIHGKLFNYPFRLREILRKIEKRKLPRVILEVATSNFIRRGNHQILEDWIKGKIGKALFDYIELDTYVRKLYGIPASEISSDWGKHRLKPIVNLSLWRALNSSFNPWAKKKKRYTYYPPAGIGQIADCLVNYITDNGGEILTDSRVEKLRVGDHGIEGVSVDENGYHRTISGDLVISSVKISDLVNMIEPKPSQEILVASDSLRFRDLIILYLIINKPKIFNYCLVYFSTKNSLFKRITEFKHFSPRMAPENLTSLAVEICTNRGDNIWKYTDRQIFEEVILQLEKLGITKRDEVIEYFTVRIPSVYPIYFLNYADHLKVIFNYLHNIKNLVSIGRHGLYQHDNMPTAIQSGFNLAELIKKHCGNELGKINKIVYQERLQKYQDIV